MKNNKLNSRQKEIIKILTKSTMNNPITVSSIAKELSLSSRTVLRELPKIEIWLEENEFKFVRKPGVGLIIDESLENQQLILELLEIEKIQKQYTREERKELIISELLISTEPLKLFYFTSLLKVSEGTLSGDLDGIEAWMKRFNIELVRKPGLGIYINAKEDDIRKAMISILYDNISENQLVEIFKDTLINKRDTETIEFSIQNRLLKFIDKSIIKSIEEIINELEKELNVKLADSAYVGLVVHLSLAIKRIKNNENIVMDNDVLNELKVLPEFSLATRMVKNIEKKFDVNIPEDEIGYITMHLKGAKLRLNAVSKELDISNLDVKQITYHIITTAEEEFDVYLREDDRLITDLTNHLVPAISRLKMKLNIRNPLLEEIKEKYSREFNVCLSACDILKQVTKIKEIPESEVAYITLHIAAALEKKIIDEKVSVVIACTTGIGTSKLLASTLKSRFKSLDIRGTISTINIDIDRLKKEGIDLIISTVELKVDYEYIRVGTIISEADKTLIRENIKRIINKKKYNKISEKTIEDNKQINNNAISMDNIKEISILGDSILSLINSIELKEFDKVDSIKDLIHKGSYIFGDNDIEAKEIEENLLNREKISTTYLPKLNIMLLHCKVSVVDNIKFAYIKLDKALVEKDNIIEGAIIELISENTNEIELKVISEINGSLLEQKGVLSTLKRGTREEIVKKMEELLLDFYKNEIKEKMRI